METYHINNGDERFGFLVEIDTEKTQAHVFYFKIYQIHSIDGNSAIDVPCVEQKVSGSIKWDGCSDFIYGNDGLIHFCDILDQITLNECLKFVWTKAQLHFNDEDFIPEWDDNNPMIKPFHNTYRVEPA